MKQMTYGQCVPASSTEVRKWRQLRVYMTLFSWQQLHNF